MRAPLVDDGDKLLRRCRTELHALPALRQNVALGTDVRFNAVPSGQKVAARQRIGVEAERFGHRRHRAQRRNRIECRHVRPPLRDGGERVADNSERENASARNVACCNATEHLTSPKPPGSALGAPSRPLCSGTDNPGTAAGSLRTGRLAKNSLNQRKAILMPMRTILANAPSAAPLYTPRLLRLDAKVRNETNNYGRTSCPGCAPRSAAALLCQAAQRWASQCWVSHSGSAPPRPRTRPSSSSSPTGSRRRTRCRRRWMIGVRRSKRIRAGPSNTRSFRRSNSARRSTTMTWRATASPT